jgi:DMSO/TMAO reductase YedYZ molybdopterin-dependent catalytic subunit
MGRRTFLGRSAAAALPLVWAAGRGLPLLAEAPGDARSLPELIVREKDPLNLESPLAALQRFVTPNPQFYVRCHFNVPRLDAAAWRLKVEGAVERPLTLTLDDLRRLPPRRQYTTLECAGNGRDFLVPRAKGVQWGMGAVSNAEWAGAPLAAVLERAGLKGNAVEVVLEGADEGKVAGQDTPIHFSRGLPVATARRPDVVLAYRMNGAELPVPHGFPARAVVPGWYGMAATKWLTRILVTDKPYKGHFQTTDYSRYVERDGKKVLVPLREMDVKSIITSPAAGADVPAGKAFRVLGAAWTGEGQVSKVEVSTDGGKTWAPARLLGEAVPGAWRLWEYDWAPRAADKAKLLTRATDSRGRLQPAAHDPDRRHYMISFVPPVEVTVR